MSPRVIEPFGCWISGAVGGAIRCPHRRLLRCQKDSAAFVLVLAVPTQASALRMPHMRMACVTPLQAQGPELPTRQAREMLL